MLAGAARLRNNPNSASSNVDYTGTWTGTYIVTSCVPTGDFLTAGLCSTVASSGQFQLVLAQSNGAVTGNFTLGSVPFTGTPATVASNGSLSFSGTGTLSGINIAVNFQLTESSGLLNGSLGQVWSSPTALGLMTITGTLSSTPKS